MFLGYLSLLSDKLCRPQGLEASWAAFTGMLLGFERLAFKGLGYVSRAVLSLTALSNTSCMYKPKDHAQALHLETRSGHAHLSLPYFDVHGNL